MCSHPFELLLKCFISIIIIILLHLRPKLQELSNFEQEICNMPQNSTKMIPNVISGSKMVQFYGRVGESALLVIFTLNSIFSLVFSDDFLQSVVKLEEKALLKK